MYAALEAPLFHGQRRSTAGIEKREDAVGKSQDGRKTLTTNYRQYRNVDADNIENGLYGMHEGGVWQK